MCDLRIDCVHRQYHSGPCMDVNGNGITGTPHQPMPSLGPGAPSTTWNGITKMTEAEWLRERLQKKEDDYTELTKSYMWAVQKMFEQAAYIERLAAVARDAGVVIK